MVVVVVLSLLRLMLCLLRLLCLLLPAASSSPPPAPHMQEHHSSAATTLHPHPPPKTKLSHPEPLCGASCATTCSSPATDTVLRYRMLGFEKQYVFGRILDYGKIYNTKVTHIIKKQLRALRLLRRSLLWRPACKAFGPVSIQ